MPTLLCPICRSALSSDGKSLSCEQHHTFDIAKEGYVNLAPGRSGSGDSREMCRARRDFLATGYYSRFAETVAVAVSEHIPSSRSLICDAGCGEGYYLREMKSHLTEAELVGFDLAKDSIRLAAKAEKGTKRPITYAVAGIFDMPLADHSCAAVTSVFAPVPSEEAHRILADKGILVIAHPGEKHLSGFRRLIYDNPYDNTEKELSYPGFSQIAEYRCRYSVFVEKCDMAALLLMTPYYWKTSREDTEKYLSHDGFETELDFIVTVLSRNDKGAYHDRSK